MNRDRQNIDIEMPFWSENLWKLNIDLTVDMDEGTEGTLIGEDIWLHGIDSIYIYEGKKYIGPQDFTNICFAAILEKIRIYLLDNWDEIVLTFVVS